jgi:hypothetical protein
LAVGLVTLVGCGGDDASADVPTSATDEAGSEAVPPEGCTGDRSVEVMTCSGLTNLHVVEAPDYPVVPPVGGDHNQVWANCGYYAGPVPPEFAVHSLEHGAVWIVYADDTGDADDELLRALASADSRLLISELEGAPAPFVLTAWGAQRAVSRLDDPAVAEFIARYQDGAGAPEPGNPCSGGLGRPDVAAPTPS